MNDITELRGLGEDSYEAIREIVGVLDGLSQEQRLVAFHGLADLLDSFQEEFSRVRRMDQPTPETEKTERVDVLVNWLREKAQNTK